MSQARLARNACALFCAAWCLGSARGEELSEREFLTDFPSVISASGLRQSVFETPQAVTVIDQEMIKATGAREFAELFRLVPGFTVSYVAHVKGFQPIVNYHGMGREFFSRMQVLIDGRSMNNATLGGVDWSEFPLALQDIDRIEVIRGPSNATHGIGAFLATINFITKHASQERGVGVSVSAGSDGIRDGVAYFGAGAEGLDYRVTVGHRADDGFAGLYDQRRRNFASLRADWQIGPTDSLMFQAGATDGENGIESKGPTDPERTAQVRTAFAQAKWERSFDADNGFFVQLYYYQYRLIDQFLTDPLSGIGNQRFALDGGSTVRRSDLEVQQTFSTGPSLRWVWGASVREDLTQVPLLFAESARLHVQRLFGHVEWRADDKVLINAGAMVEHNNLTGTDVAPQLALNYTFAPFQVVRFNVSKALRTPTVIENQGRFAVGPPGTPRFGPAGELNPETIVSCEVSYIGEWPAQHVTLDAKAFYNTITDLIGLVGVQATSPAASYPRNAVNGDDARQQGIEGQLAWRPTPETLLMGMATYVETRSADRIDHYSTSSPRTIFHALASHRFAGSWDASVAFQQQSGFRASGLSDPQRAFSRIDLRLGKRLPIGMGRGEVAVVVENVFNNHYTEYRLNNVAERRAWATLSFAF